MFTYESEHPVILLVNTMEHIVGDDTLSRKIKKIPTCWTSGQGFVERPTHRTTRPFDVPDVNNGSNAFSFDSHDHIV